MRDEPLLYDVTDSPFCAKARICLQMKGVSYRRVTLTRKTRRDLLQLNPLGKVPVLIDRGRPIADSSAIARHLEETHPEPPLLPSDSTAAAYCRVLEDWADESLYFAIGAFKWLNPANRSRAVARTTSEIDAGVLAPLVSRLIVRQVVGRYRAWRYTAESLPHFEERIRENLGWLAELVSGRDFLLGRSLTLADIAVYVQFAWMRGYVEGKLLDEQPAVLAWLERMDAVPAVSDGFGAE
jgi:glutathione S-transferase